MYALAEEGCAVVGGGDAESPRTDIGARVLCMAALRSPVKSAEDITRTADRIVFAMGLDAENLDATLGVVTNDSYFKATLFGDGVIAMRGADTIYVTIVSWAADVPGYLSYGLWTERRDAFVRRSQLLAHTLNSGAACVATSYEYPATGGGWQPKSTAYQGALTGLRGYTVHGYGDTDLMAVFTGDDVRPHTPEAVQKTLRYVLDAMSAPDFFLESLLPTDRAALSAAFNCDMVDEAPTDLAVAAIGL